MKVLLVSKAQNGQPSVFVREQAQSLAARGVDTEFLPIDGSGLKPYLTHPVRLARRLDRGDVDIVHAYYGLSGLTALFESRVPLVMSFLGCDFNTWTQRQVAKATLCRKAAKCLFMSQRMRTLAGPLPGAEVLPFGVDLDRFAPADRQEARSRLGLSPGGRYVLFASSYDRPEKDPDLARRAVERLGPGGPTLLEFKTTYSPRDVVDLYNACDALLMTSKREGSPQVIKEALACGLPVVSTPVGDVAWVLGDSPGSRVAAPDPATLSQALDAVLRAGDRTHGRKRLLDLGLDLPSTAARLAGIYREVLKATSR